MSTKTNVLYYRAGFQSSYQFTKDLAVGVGVNSEILIREEIDFAVANIGQQINKSCGLDYSLDAGLFYKINPRNFLTVA